MLPETPSVRSTPPTSMILSAAFACIDGVLASMNSAMLRSRRFGAFGVAQINLKGDHSSKNKEEITILKNLEVKKCTEKTLGQESSLHGKEKSDKMAHFVIHPWHSQEFWTFSLQPWMAMFSQIHATVVEPTPAPGISSKARNCASCDGGIPQH